MMKTKIKKVLALLTLSLGILAVAPSDAKAETAVTGTKIIDGISSPITVECQKFVPRYYEVGANGTLRSRAELYVTRQEMVNSVLTLFYDVNESDEGLISQFNYSAGIATSYNFVGIETLNGVQVYHFSENIDVSASQDKPEEMTAHTFKISEWRASWLANVFKGDKVRFKMPFKVAKTNGVLLEDGQTVEFTSTLDDERNAEFCGMYFWAVDEQASQAGDINFTNVKNGGYYDYVQIADVKIQSSGLITSVEIRTVDEITNKFVAWSKSPKYYFSNTTVEVRVSTASGTSKTVKFIADNRSPKIDINKYYKSSVEVLDDNIKSVILDGKKLKRTSKNGSRHIYKTKLSKGNHNVVALDKAGHIVIKKFTISSSGKVKNLKSVKDKTKPSTNIRAKSYKKSVKITFSDYYGVAKATLNDKVIKNNHKVSKKGSYTLKIWDYAGNCKTVKFKIKK